jgi:hypothetical protein
LTVGLLLYADLGPAILLLRRFVGIALDKIPGTHFVSIMGVELVIFYLLKLLKHTILITVKVETIVCLSSLHISLH